MEKTLIHKELDSESSRYRAKAGLSVKFEVLHAYITSKPAVHIRTSKERRSGISESIVPLTAIHAAVGEIARAHPSRRCEKAVNLLAYE
jgi:hypothetical protein